MESNNRKDDRVKINDRRHSSRTPASSSLVMAKTASDVSRAKVDMDAERALSLGSRLGSIPTDDAQVREGVLQRMRRTAGDISLSGQKPRNLEFWHRRNNNFYDIDSDGGLNDLREVCTSLYAAHPLIGSAVDIYSKWPVVGAEFRCKDEKLVEFYSDLFFDDLNYEDFLVDIGREYWTVGEALPLGTWNETLGVWQADELVPPQDVTITKTPFSREPFMEMALPETVRRIISTREPAHEYRALVQNYPDLVKFANLNQRIPISNHLLKQIRFKGKTFHERGIPIMTRGIRAVLQEEMLNGAQDSISDRLATPLVVTKIGASASDLGTQTPWIPTRAEINAFQDLMDAALQADFRMLTTHFGVDVSSVFGRETMPNFDSDFERLGERILQVFGMSKTMLSGAASGQTYAADAMNRDLITQLSGTYQRTLRRFVRDRMLVVAEAQGHYDYETRGGKRYPIMEERLIVDENGNQRIEERPKLLVPDLYLKPMNLTETAAMEDFFNAATALGIPISARTRFANWDIDFEEEVEQSREETIRRAIEVQETRKATYLALKERGLPIPEDLKEDFEPKVSGGSGSGNAGQGVAAPMDQGGDPPPPLLGIEPLGSNGEGPAQGPQGDQTPGQEQAEVPGDEDMSGLPTLEELASPRHRPRESDEQRKDMPKRLVALRTEDKDGGFEEVEVEAGGMIAGPSHIGLRVHALDEWRKRQS